MSFWSDVIDDIAKYGGFGLVGAGAEAATSTAGGLAGIGTIFEAVWTELTDVRMWRSLGWLVLGIILMLLGVAWWIGPSAARRSPLGLAAGAAGRLAT
jgi:hypothetical protein